VINTRIRFLALPALAVTILSGGQSYAQNSNAGASNAKPGGTAGVSGNGTPGTLAKWGGTTTLASSVITEDKFGLVGVGTVTPTSRLTVVGAVESKFGGFKFPDGTVQVTAGITPDQVVTSLNGLRGDVALNAGQNITLSVLGNAVTIAAPNVLTSVVGDATLAGNGTAAAPLGLANGAVTAPKIAALAAPAAGQFLSFDGSNLVWQSPAAAGAVVTDATLEGDGSSASPLKVAAPLFLQTDEFLNQGTTGVLNVDGLTNNNGIHVRGGAAIPGLIGGVGVLANGGDSDGGLGGFGVAAAGGDTRGGDFAGNGVTGLGGIAFGEGSIAGAGVEGRAGIGGDGGIDGPAGLFSGDVRVFGDVDTTGAKTLKMDHPLDPENKYLRHAAVESSEVLNVYSGNAVTDASGEVIVELPAWFEALNTDLRYQLTVVGTFAQAIVARKVQNNRFAIKTDVPNVEVSWQVTGVRSDAVARKRPFVAEAEKPPRERGSYLTPEAFDQPEEKGVEWARHPERMKRLKEAREQKLLEYRKQSR
jgi:hypothetical protein